MNKLFVATSLLLVFLYGCQSYDISFYDDNESMLAVNILVAVDRINCENPSTSRPQFYLVKENITTLQIYTIAKGSSDITDVLGDFQETIDPVLMKDEISGAYCRVKKNNLETQGISIAKAIMRRF